MAARFRPIRSKQITSDSNLLKYRLVPVLDLLMTRQAGAEIPVIRNPTLYDSTRVRCTDVANCAECNKNTRELTHPACSLIGY